MTVLYRYTYIFAVCSILGFIVENIWCLLKNRRIESRKSLIYGPFSVVYGIGGTVLTFVLGLFHNTSDILIFLVSFMAGTIVEYVCSLCQEKIFGSISWDYKDFPLNINGRVCFYYSIFWGVLGVMWYNFAIPVVDAIASVLLQKGGNGLAISFILFFVFDVLVSAIAVIRMVKRANGEKAKNKIQIYFDRHFPDDKMNRIYANMKLIITEVAENNF